MTATAPPAAVVPPSGFARRLLIRSGLMVLLWLGLNGADGRSWIIGGPVALAAAWLSVKLLPDASWSWNIGRVFGFAGYFLRESLRGGWDVATRALSPGFTLTPALISYPLSLPGGPARLFFISVISLLPGTAVVEIGTDDLRIHVLDLSPASFKELRELERRVAALFGLAFARREEGAA